LGDGNPESGNYNLELGNCHPESLNYNPDSGNSSLGKQNDRQGEELVPMDVNMVFTILIEFYVPTEDVTKLALGAECVMFKKPKNLSAHMKPLFIRGTWTERRSDTCSLMEVQASTSCRCYYSRSSAMSKGISNVQILALAVLQVIRQRQKE
jgi:hypothetical protein